ncbi:MAG TPA: hypothetical protein VKD90_25045 [Gemmataceae bacterium]|nr:hypothetical protein [Gemmataceae bacterium]
MSKRTTKSVRLGVEALDARIVPAVDNFIYFHSEAPAGSVAVQESTDNLTFTFGTVFTRSRGEVISSDSY